MLPVRELLPHLRPAQAGLARSVWVYRYQPATSICSFVRKLGEEGSPSYIVDGLGEHPSRQSPDVKVLYRNRPEVVDQPERELVLELVALVLDSGVYLLKQCYSLAASIRALLAPGNLALGTAERGFGILVEPGIGNGFSIGQSGEVNQPDINPDFIVKGRKSVGCILNRQANIPLTALPLERGGLDLPDQGSVEFDLDVPNALDTKHPSIEPDAITVGGKGDAIKPAAGFEPWISGIVPAFYPSEERLECLIHPAKHVLGAGIIRKTAILGRTYLPKLVSLVVVVERLTASLVGIPALLESSIVETASLAKLDIQSCFLEACRE